jgi:mannose-6-phosphate isomerase-like protein (cupin superfamily)
MDRIGSEWRAASFKPRTGRSILALARQAPGERSKSARRSSVAVFNKDIIELATKNKNFQKEVYFDANCQIVLMSIEAGDDIGEETHEADQTTFFVAGEGQAVVDGSRTKVIANRMIVIPKGAKHNIINKGDGPLKLFTIYSPPAEEQGISHKTKEEAEAAEAE